MLDEFGLPELSPLVENFEQILEGLAQTDVVLDPSSLKFVQSDSAGAMTIKPAVTDAANNITAGNNGVLATARNPELKSRMVAENSPGTANKYHSNDSIPENSLQKGSQRVSTAMAPQHHSKDDTNIAEKLTALNEHPHIVPEVLQHHFSRQDENPLKTAESYLLPDSMLDNSPIGFLRSNYTNPPATVPDWIENMNGAGPSNVGVSAALFNPPDKLTMSSQLESHHQGENFEQNFESHQENSLPGVLTSNPTADVESQLPLSDRANGNGIGNTEGFTLANNSSDRLSRVSQLKSDQQPGNLMRSFKHNLPLSGVRKNARPRAIAPRPALTDLSNGTRKGSTGALVTACKPPTKARNRVPKCTTRRKRGENNDSGKLSARHGEGKLSLKCNENNSSGLNSVVNARVYNNDLLARQQKIVPKDVIDIDSQDPDSSECLAVIQKLMVEERTMNVRANYMETQPELRRHHRRTMVNWLVDCHLRMELSPNTLHLGVALMDGFLSRERVKLNYYSVLSVACLYVASKYEDEENKALSAAVFARVANGDFTADHLISFELQIVQVLDFGLSVPTPLMFLERTLKAAKTLYDIDNAVKHLANYILELALCEYESIRYLPSQLAASAVSLASQGKMLWGASIAFYSGGYSQSDLSECADYLRNLIVADLNMLNGQSNAVYQKYSKENFGRIVLAAQYLTGFVREQVKWD